MIISGQSGRERIQSLRQSDIFCFLLDANEETVIINMQRSDAAGFCSVQD